MKPYQIVLFIIILLMIVGCNDNILNSDSGFTFYPLHVGNYWEYEIQKPDSSVTENTIFDKIIADTVINDQKYYEVKSPLYRSPLCCDFQFYYSNKYDGLYFTYSYGVNNNHLFKYPCIKNEFYLTEPSYDTTFVVSLSDTVNTKVGNFNCIVYKRIERDSKQPNKVFGIRITYVARGVGTIKTEYFTINQDGVLIKSYEYLLSKYILN